MTGLGNLSWCLATSCHWAAEKGGIAAGVRSPLFSREKMMGDTDTGHHWINLASTFFGNKMKKKVGDFFCWFLK